MATLRERWISRRLLWREYLVFERNVFILALMTLQGFEVLRRAAVAALLPLLAVPSSYGWGNVGHSMINKLAAESLPADMPAFMHSDTAIAEIEYLGPEPDRWRSPAEPELNAAQAQITLWIWNWPM